MEFRKKISPFALVFACVAFLGAELPLSAQVDAGGRTTSQDSVLNHLEEAYKVQPNDERLQAWIGALVQNQKVDEAQRAVERHAKRMRNRSLFYTADQAFVAKKGGRTADYQSALQAAVTGAVTQPGNASPLSDRFKSYGLYAEAVRVLEAAEQGVPGLRFTYQKVLLWADLGDLPRVYQGYVQLLDENPGFGATLQLFLSNSQDDEGHIPQSSVLYDALIGRLQQGSSRPHENLLVWCYTQERLFSDALVQWMALDRRSGGDPTHRLAILQLGQAAEHAGMDADAEACFQYLVSIGRDGPFAREAHEALWQLQGRLPERFASLRHSLKAGLAQGAATWPVAWQPAARLALARVWVAGWNRVDSAAQLLAGIPNQLPDQEPLRGEMMLFLGDLDLLSARPFDALLRYAEVAQDFGGNPLGDEAAYRKARVSYLTGDLAWAKSQWEVLKTSTSKKIANDALARTQLLDEVLAEDSTGWGIRPYARAELLMAQQSTAAAGTVLDSLLGVLPAEHPLRPHVLLAWARWNRDRSFGAAAEAAYEQLTQGTQRSALADDAMWEWAQILEAKNDALSTEAARALYLQLMETYPDSYWSELARQRYRPGAGKAKPKTP
jgi:hypothetical protein